MESETGLVADVGRHAVRFGLVDGADGSAPYEIRRYETERHSTFTGALLTYLDEVGRRGANLPSALAVAGAVQGDLVNITGSRWFISLDGIAAVLGRRPRALNECAANAMALSGLKDGDFRALPGPRPSLPGVKGRYLLVGVGTGLGTAGLIGDGHHFHAIDSEAGHMRLAVETPECERFVAWCRRRGITPECETLVSGPGLAAAYAALTDTVDTAKIDPRDVVRRAGADPQARAACEMVARAIWAYASDMALAFGAWNGVFLAGAVTRALAPMLTAPQHRVRFEQVGAFRRQLAAIPVALVERDDLELAGAAAAMRGHAGASRAN